MGSRPITSLKTISKDKRSISADLDLVRRDSQKSKKNIVPIVNEEGHDINDLLNLYSEKADSSDHGSELGDHVLSNDEHSDILQMRHSPETLKLPTGSRKSGTGDTLDDQASKIRMTKNIYDRICGEFRCGICKNIYEEPKWLPCLHVFCHKCIR